MASGGRVCYIVCFLLRHSYSLLCYMMYGILPLDVQYGRKQSLIRPTSQQKICLPFTTAALSLCPGSGWAHTWAAPSGEIFNLALVLQMVCASHLSALERHFPGGYVYGENENIKDAISFPYS